MDQEIAVAARRGLAGHGGGLGYSSGVLARKVGGGMVTAASLANINAPELGMQIAAAMVEAAWTG